MNKEFLFLLPVFINEKLERAITETCFGTCGKVSVIETENIGPCFVCTQQVCPNVKQETEVIGTSQMTGEELKIRIINFDSE